MRNLLSFCVVNIFDRLRNFERRLNLMGTNIKVAAKALEKANNDLEKAADAIHDEMVTAVNKNPFNSHLNLWVPRLSLRISTSTYHN